MMLAAKGKYKDWITDENLVRIETLAKKGLTDAQIAKAMGISKTTFYDWKHKFPEFSNSLKKSKDFADKLVESALIQSAMGYYYEEVTKEPLVNPITGEPTLDTDGDVKMVVTKSVRKLAPPNTTALIFWLKNRKPHEWSDRKEKYINSTGVEADDEEL